MNQRNADIKKYICDQFAIEDQALFDINKNAKKRGVPDISVSPYLGKLIYFFVKLQKPRRILEVGTLAGYSTVWLAKGAPTAKIITLENNPHHASVARENFKNVGIDSQIDLIEGNALQILRSFVECKKMAFDLIFLDANNEEYPEYLPFLLQISKRGTMLVTDNLIPKEGAIGNPDPIEKESVRTYEYNSMLKAQPNLETIFITTIVGEKGRADALAVSLIS